jgi:hypothetical protein
MSASMTAAPRTYPDWKAPRNDAELLVWPDAESIRATARLNHSRVQNSNAKFANVPLGDLRRQLRAELNLPSDAPIIASGHQVELHHPGVWVKNVVASIVAKQVGGVALHVAVDTDAPKHLALRWPGAAMPITDDSRINTAAWSGLLKSPSQAHLARMKNEMNHARTSWTFQPMIPQFLDSLQTSAARETSLPAAMTSAMQSLDRSFGIDYQSVQASTVWSTRVFLGFVYECLCRADVFANHYNAALRDYRIEQHISSPMRPMPDLQINSDAVEIPFWLDDLHRGARQRPSVFRDHDGWALSLFDDTPLVFDPTMEFFDGADRLSRFLDRSNCRLSPRALTLTLFLRLVACDYFFHGIGGARYDQVCDRLISEHYKIDPPGFGVATATLLFPASIGVEQTCWTCLKQEGHRLRHAAMGKSKFEFLKSIESHPRHSPQRGRLYAAMHRALSEKRSQDAPLREWAARYESAMANRAKEEALFDRELFYALQSAGRLQGLVGKIRNQLGE